MYIYNIIFIIIFKLYIINLMLMKEEIRKYRNIYNYVKHKAPKHFI